MLSKEIQDKFPALKDYLSRQPIEKAWLFGSYSRGEETPTSDIDIMVCYREDVPVGLLTIGGIYNDLKRVLGRDVDIVEEGYLMPFARQNAYNDRILIYERGN